MNEKREIGEARYDYDRQTWVLWNGKAWVVEECAHPRKFQGCYACKNAGEVITTGLDKIR